jgi:hypothetical protein
MRDKTIENSDRLHTAILHAAHIVVDKGFMGSYQIAQMQRNNDGVKNLSSAISKIGMGIDDKELMASELTIRRNMQNMEERLNVTPEQWAKDFQWIGQKRKAIELLEQAVNIARPVLAAAAEDLSDTLPDKPDFPAESSAAYRRTREHLIANPRSPRWLALLLFTLARAIGSNTRAGFASNEWHEGTLFWFAMERAWLEGDGASVGKLLLEGDKKFFKNRVAVNLGTDMPRKLAEAASIAPSWSLFHPPW